MAAPPARVAAPAQSPALAPRREQIAEVARAHNLTYQIGALDSFATHVAFKGARVLEVGGSLPDDLTRNLLETSCWHAVDDRAAYVAARDGGAQVGSADGLVAERIQDLEVAAGSYDLIVSIAAFEHIPDMATALAVMHRALAEDGRLCVQAGPLWSGWRGHHVMPGYFPDMPGLAQRFVDHVRPWQHLAQSRPEMYADLTKAGFTAEEAARLVESIYDSPRLNRMMFEEYVTYFKLTGWNVEKLSLWPTPDFGPAHKAAAEARHPWVKSWDVDGFTAILRKA